MFNNEAFIKKSKEIIISNFEKRYETQCKIYEDFKNISNCIFDVLSNDKLLENKEIVDLSYDNMTEKMRTRIICRRENKNTEIARLFKALVSLFINGAGFINEENFTDYNIILKKDHMINLDKAEIKNVVDTLAIIRKDKVENLLENYATIDEFLKYVLNKTEPSAKFLCAELNYISSTMIMIDLFQNVPIVDTCLNK